MDDNNDNEKVEGYITLSKSVQESINKTLPNSEFINGISKGLIDAIKPIADYNLNIAKIYSDKLLKTQKMINAMIEPITEITRKIVELYEPIMNNTISNITKIFKKIDWSKFDLIYKEIAIKYLSNGFYPYRNTEIKYEELLNTNNKSKQLKIIKQGIRLDIKKNKKVLILTYPEYKKEINELYKLYKEHNYRLCILSLINLISIINNSQFKYIDFTEKDKVRGKLLEKQIMKDKETNYLVFSQYIKDNDLISANVLIRNCRSDPEKYLKIPFNRNAILHGYSKKFGNEANCLRWFSVLFNTMEISQKTIELEENVIKEIKM